MEKSCSKCKEVKNTSEFHKDKHQADGLKYKCKECCSVGKCKAWGKDRRDNGVPDDKKRCYKCRRYLDRTDFYSNKHKWDGLGSWCKDCSSLSQGRNGGKVNADPTRYRYEELLKSQMGKCAICGSDKPSGTKANQKRFSLDHDHETGEIRGLLCDHCNRGLGMFGDDASVLAKAAEYLTRHNNKETSACHSMSITR